MKKRCLFSTKAKFTESAFSIDQKGSAGIGVILWMMMLLVFLIIPLMLFFFELNTHITYGTVSGSVVDNLLDQVEWHVETPSLSTADVVFEDVSLKTKLSKDIEEKLSLPQSALKLESVDVLTKANQGLDHATLNVKVVLSYAPSTYLGRVFSGERIYLEVHRIRETPIDE